jgi:flagellar hook assembly protein FlgD
MKIYNIKGQLVKTLCNEKKQANSYKIEWKGKNDADKTVSSGIYFCRIQVGDKSETKKMMLIK